MICSRGLDLAITDGSHIRKGGMIRRDKETGALYGHTGIPDLIRMFKDYTPNILFVHMGNWFVKDPAGGKEKAPGAGQRKRGQCHGRVDGMELDLKLLEVPK